MKGLKLMRAGDVSPDRKVWVIAEVEDGYQARYMYYVGVLSKMLAVDLNDIKGSSRKDMTSIVRAMAWLRLRNADGLSVMHIGKIAKRNYSTVVVLTNKLEGLMEVDRTLRKMYDVFNAEVERERDIDEVKLFGEKFKV